MFIHLGNFSVLKDYFYDVFMHFLKLENVDYHDMLLTERQKRFDY